jgi:hypothetical protein
MLRVTVERHEDELVFVTLWISSVDGETEGPTWGVYYERARLYVDDLYQRLGRSRP